MKRHWRSVCSNSRVFYTAQARITGFSLPQCVYQIAILNIDIWSDCPYVYGIAHQQGHDVHFWEA